MQMDIPGRGPITLDYVVFDFNGTLALDGQVSLQTEELLKNLASRYSTLIATADTFGTVAHFAQRLRIPVEIVKTGKDKEDLVQQLTGGVVAVGNGANDEPMFLAADLAIGVMGPEGASVQALLAADIWVPTIERGLELLIHPDRLIATLRE